MNIMNTQIFHNIKCGLKGHWLNSFLPLIYQPILTKFLFNYNAKKT